MVLLDIGWDSATPYAGAILTGIIVLTLIISYIWICIEERKDKKDKEENEDEWYNDV